MIQVVGLRSIGPPAAHTEPAKFHNQPTLRLTLDSDDCRVEFLFRNIRTCVKNSGIQSDCSRYELVSRYSCIGTAKSSMVHLGVI